MRIVIDEYRCVAAGQCVSAAADVFDQRDEDGVVVLLNPNPTADQAEGARRAAAFCPAMAIQIEE
jgi:ferredoxin